MRVLLVERESSFRDALAQHLREQGHRVAVSHYWPRLEQGDCPASPDLAIVAQECLSRGGPGTPVGLRSEVGKPLPLVLIVPMGKEESPPLYGCTRLLGTLVRPFPLAVLDWHLRSVVKELAEPPDTPSRAEGRRSLRVRCCRAATLVWRSNGSHNTQAGVLRDVSLHGASFRTVGDSRPGERARLDLLVPGLVNRTLRFSGTAVRCNLTPRGQQVIGIEWGALNVEQRAGVANLFQRS